VLFRRSVHLLSKPSRYLVVTHVCFQIQLRGVANFLDSNNKAQIELFGPEVKTEDAASRKTRFDFLKPNTNYTVEVCAVTRRKECGQATSTSCKMRQTSPRAEHLNRFQWFTDSKSGHPVFRLRMPQLSERNGRICCLRVIVVKLKQGNLTERAAYLSPFADLPSCRREFGGPSSPVRISNFQLQESSPVS
jgi:hypothetical protein